MSTKTVDQMLANAGIYTVIQPAGMFFVEVLTNGECHQLTPDTFAHDGELIREGWRDDVPAAICGPLVRPSVAPPAPEGWAEAVESAKHYAKLPYARPDYEEFLTLARAILSMDAAMKGKTNG